MQSTFAMRAAFVVALSALALLSVPSRVEAADGRVTVTPDGTPWASIGRLNVAGYRQRRHCTATLVASDLILTARHCLSGLGSGSWADPAAVHFLAGYSRGQYKAHRTASGYIPLGDEATLVRLSSPIDLPVVAIYDGPRPKAGVAIAQAGYSGDRGHVLTVDPTCHYLGLTDRGRWRHDCEAIGGDSGSPLLIDQPGGLMVAAIHIGRTDGIGIAEAVTRNAMDAAR
jgi:protease YdgD